jgi:hypothetical protein
MLHLETCSSNSSSSSSSWKQLQTTSSSISKSVCLTPAYTGAKQAWETGSTSCRLARAAAALVLAQWRSSNTAEATTLAQLLLLLLLRLRLRLWLLRAA